MEAARASFNDSVMNDFTDDSRKKQREAGLPTVLLLSALIYMGLYGFFIFGNAVYMYSDVGSDSLSSSYPIITMLARLYREKQFSFYTLSSGLGSDTSATFLQYLNPLKFLLLNFSSGVIRAISLSGDRTTASVSAYCFLPLPCSFCSSF